MSEKQGKCILLAPELEPLNEPGRFRGTLTQLEWLDKFTREDKTVGDKTPVFGAKGHTGQAYNMGFYSAIKLAYNYHFVLKTCPEDWWYCISQKVGLAIDKNAKKQEVRDFFVSHEEKKKLVVYVDNDIPLYKVDYRWFFDQIADQIEKNINVPEYVKIMEADFSESSQVHRIVSRIVLMTSMQEFFTYRMETRCGLPGVIMKGSEEDWKNLKVKLQKLEALLKPIEKHLELDGWWAECAEVCSKLLDTHQGNADTDWWSKIIAQTSNGSGPSYLKGCLFNNS